MHSLVIEHIHYYWWVMHAHALLLYTMLSHNYSKRFYSCVHDNEERKKKLQRQNGLYRFISSFHLFQQFVHSLRAQKQFSKKAFWTFIVATVAAAAVIVCCCFSSKWFHASYSITSKYFKMFTLNAFDVVHFVFECMCLPVLARIEHFLSLHLYARNQIK